VAVRVQDEVVFVVDSTPVALVDQDCIGGVWIPEITNESPADGSINNLPDVTIYFEID
jgi:hypothetical protein